MNYFICFCAFSFLIFQCSPKNNKELNVNSITNFQKEVELKYIEAEKDIHDSLAVDGLKYFGMVEINNPKSKMGDNWYRITIVYEYNQPKKKSFNPDSILISEYVCPDGCFFGPSTCFFLVDEEKSNIIDSTFISNNAYEYGAMRHRKIENFKMTNIQNANFYQIIPLCFFDAKRTSKLKKNENDKIYRAVGATLFFYYDCDNFDINKLIENNTFKEMILNKDKSKIILSSDFKKIKL